MAIQVKLDGTCITRDELRGLADILRKYPGDAPVRIELVDTLGSVTILANQALSVDPTEGLRSDLNQVDCVMALDIRNGNPR